MTLEQTVVALWMLLDDIDTLDDACKGDDAIFRRCARIAQRKRFSIVSGEEFDALCQTLAPPSIKKAEGERE